LTSISFRLVLVADPTPKLSQKHDKCETCREDISGRTYSNGVFVEGETMGMNRHADCYEEGDKEPGETNHGIGDYILVFQGPVIPTSSHDNHKYVDCDGLG